MAVTTHRELDVSVVRSFLRSLREGRVFIARITKSGRNGKYAYLMPPLDLLRLIGVESGDRFRIVIGDGYVDYIRDAEGYMITVTRREAKIRFPLDIKGYVVLEPRPRGFRVYFA